MDKFIELFKETLEIEDHAVYANDEFRSYDEWDSIAYISLIAMIDEEYGIQIAEADFKKLRTIEDLFNVVSK